MVAECSTGAAAIEDIAAHCPDIAVIDAQLPDLGADGVVSAVRSRNLETRMIILGTTPDRNLADSLLAAGADAYIVRNGPSRHLNDAIRYVRDGGKYLAPQLTRDLPVLSGKALGDEHNEAVAQLRTAVATQARTVARLEEAMERAQYAIELLQQKIEQLSGTPVESQPPVPSAVEDASAKSRALPGLRSGIGQVAAALMIGIVGFVLAGVLRPSAASTIAEYTSIGTEDALKAGSSDSLNLAGWEAESVEKASGLLSNQQYAAAEKLARRLLQQNPANAMISRILASALYHQGKVAESADVISSTAVPAPPVAKTPAPKVVF